MINIKRKIWLIALFFFLLSLLFIVNETYSLLESIGVADASVQTGKWSIKINDANISAGVVENFVIDNIVYDNEVANVDEDYFSPGRVGHFDIVLDPSDTDVAIKYDIIIDLDTVSYPDNIIFSLANLSGSAALEVEPNHYSGVIGLDDIDSDDLITLRLSINWLDDRSYDYSDTELGILENNHLSIPIVVNLSQYLGE